MNPHLVAAWSTAPPLELLQPPRDAAGRYDLRRLTDLLEQPVRAAIRPPQKTVWHCSIRNHPTDRILSDQQWRTWPASSWPPSASLRTATATARLAAENLVRLTGTNPRAAAAVS